MPMRRCTHGRDDAMALTLAGFNIGIVEHDREVARETRSRQRSR